LLWVLALSLGGPVALATSEQTQRLVRFNAGVVAFTGGQYSEAQIIFKELVDSDPNDAAALYYLGLTYLQLGDYERASETLERVTRLDPALMDLAIREEARLDLALAHVGGKDYAAGKAALEQFLAANVGDARSRAIAYFYLGIAEFHLEHYDAAMPALNEAARLLNEIPADERRGPRQPEIDFYRGLVSWRQGNREQAQTYLTSVEQSEVASPRLRGAARTFIRDVQTGAAPPRPVPEAVAAAPAVSPFQATVRFGLNYDTNVILLGDNTILPSNISNEEDIRFGLTSDFVYRIPVNDRLEMAVGGGTFHSWHASVDEFNVQTYAGRFSLNYRVTNDLTAGIQYDFDYNFVGNDDFLARHRVTPLLRLTERYDADGTPRTWSTLEYSYEDRDYQVPTIRQLDRDGNYHTVTVSQGFNMCQPWKARNDSRWVRSSIGYRLHSASTVGDEFDQTSHGLLATLTVPLPWELNFDFTGQWTWEDYKQPSLFDFKRKEREDFVQTYVWSLGRGWVLNDHVNMEIRGDIILTVDDATITDRLKEAVFSYDRVIYGVSVAFTFR
jgi:TolA-binding protein